MATIESASTAPATQFGDDHVGGPARRKLGAQCAGKAATVLGRKNPPCGGVRRRHPPRLALVEDTRGQVPPGLRREAVIRRLLRGTSELTSVAPVYCGLVDK